MIFKDQYWSLKISLILVFKDGTKTAVGLNTNILISGRVGTSNYGTFEHQLQV